MRREEGVRGLERRKERVRVKGEEGGESEREMRGGRSE